MNAYAESGSSPGTYTPPIHLPVPIDREALAQRIASAFAKLADHKEDIETLWREFAALQPNETIMGCKTKTEFCERILGRSIRAVRYMLDGGNQNRQEKVSPTEETPKPEPAESESSFDSVETAHRAYLDASTAENAALRTLQATTEWRAHETAKAATRRAYERWQRLTKGTNAASVPSNGVEYVDDFLTQEEANDLYARMMQEPWLTDGSHRDRDKIDFGKSYSHDGGADTGEIPEIPEFLQSLAAKVASHTDYPVNYVQCHRFKPGGDVPSHLDPSGMCVPMIVCGQERTFHVGEHHVLLKHGSLLTFLGGKQTRHSMASASKDTQFSPNGFDYRISLLFR